MDDIESLINKILAEKDPSVIRRMALRLADTGDARTPKVLVELIKRPDLVNYRATLVNCLGGFDYSEYFHILVGLVIDGNWEVANEAFDLINSIEFISGDQVTAAFDDLEQAKEAPDNEGWRRALIKDLLSMYDA